MATRVAIIKAIRTGGAVALVCLAGALAPTPTPAQVPPDEAWRTLTTPNFRVTFPADLESLARRAADRAEVAWSELSREFVPPPSGRVDILLTDHTDVSNGFAQVTPSNRITIYARPPVDEPGLGYFDDWMELVLTHELTHIFHLDRPGPLGRALRSVFGRAPATWPFFPGLGLPLWAAEGVATWFESRLTDSGRVRGTYHDMFLRAAALEGRFERLDQASGDSPVWPGGHRAYAYGSLFFAYLLDKHGPERMVAFTEAVAGQWIPYRLNAAGRKAFGASISDEWRLWTEEKVVAASEARAAAERLGALTDPEAVTRGARIALYPRISREGSRLAYASSDGRSDTRVRFTDPDGRNASGVRTNGLATFDWIPGGRLLFSQLDYETTYDTYGDLWVWRPDGVTRRVTHGGRLSQPSGSPDGSWAVAVQDGGGTNALVRVDLATGELDPVTLPDPDVHWAFPAVSPDGRWIAASRWTPGAYLDVVVLDTAGAVILRVTDDRAMDLAPTWAPDGHMLLWGSDRTRIPNILAATVDPESRFVGPIRMATNVMTGAMYPSVDSEGAWVQFSGYHADGWDVERVPFMPDAWPVAPSPSPRFDAPARPAAVQAARSEGEVRTYSALRTLLPTYWEPLYRGPTRTGTILDGDAIIPGRQVMPSAVGVHSSGLDLVGRHAWELSARVFTDGERAEGSASYAFAGLGNPILSVGASQVWDEDGAGLGRREEDAPYDTLFVLERTRSLAASVTFLRPRWRSDAALSLSAGLSWEKRDLLDVDLAPSRHYHLNEPESRFADVRATLAFTRARSAAFQVGAARGLSVLVSGRVRTHLSLPDSALGSPGPDRSVDDVVAQVRAYHALGGPGFASHVLALRVSAGAARGPGADAGHFEVGGAAGGLGSFTGLGLFGGTSLFFPVRGYPEVARYGRIAWSASAEYRFPFALVNRGMGAWPLSLDRVVGALFADAGNAWGPELGIRGYQNPRRGTLASVGGEVIGRFLALWSMPVLLRGGVGFPVAEGEGPRAYVRLGLSF